MRITVLLGGPSAEREVSLKSGEAVAAALRRVGHDVVEVDAREKAVRDLRPDRQDVVFIALHGPFGEDGTVQAILEARGIPYTGSDERASRAAMDKVVTKRVFRRAGIFTPESLVVPVAEADLDVAAAARLGFPLVVKPARQGSSIGITLVREETQWRPALKTAFEHGETAVVEHYVEGRELTVGILAGRTLPVIELRPHREFYDYDAKYVGRQTDYRLDPDLPEGTLADAQQMARRAYQVLGCRDFGRVDLILDTWQRPFILEVNTIPGFTGHSLVPMAARAAGIAFEDLCDRIARLAWDRRGLFPGAGEPARISA